MSKRLLIRELLKSARFVSRETPKKTGKSSLFHFFDFLVSYLKYGCSENHYLNEDFYKLRSFDRKNTVTKGRKNKICGIFNDAKFAKYFSDKVLFNRTFGEYVKRDWVYAREATDDEIFSFVSIHKKVIVKPINLNKGRGIYLLDKDKLSEESLHQLRNDNCLLEEYIDQHPAMQWGSQSVNSIRVITVLDGNGKVHVLKAGMRCGVGNSIVDNFSAGGGFYPLNLNGGFVEGYGEFGCEMNYSGIHPGTDNVIIGFQIPHWNKLIDMIKKAALIIPQVRYVGWDVAILPEGVELIEGNNGPGCTLLECVGEKRGFYKEIMSYR